MNALGLRSYDDTFMRIYSIEYMHQTQRRKCLSDKHIRIRFARQNYKSRMAGTRLELLCRKQLLGHCLP